jgi:hypothetical protein
MSLYVKSDEEFYAKVLIGEFMLHVTFLTYYFINPIGRRF